MLDLFQNILETMSLAVYVVRMGDVDDLDTWNIEYANPASEDCTGVKVSEALALGFIEIFPAIRENKLLVESYQRVYHSGESLDLGIIAFHDDRLLGDKSKNLTGYFRLRVTSPGQPYVVLMFENFTEKHNLESERETLQKLVVDLRKAKKSAEVAVRAKAAFLSNMSHELRTPMNGIVGMLDLLATDTRVSESQRELIGTCIRSAGVLTTLLDDLLLYSRVEHARIELDSLNFSLRELVEDVMTLAEAASDEGSPREASTTRSATRVNHGHLVSADVPDALVGDPTRLRQMLNNLIGNAIKFTTHGEIAIEVFNEGLVVEEDETPPLDGDVVVGGGGGNDSHHGDAEDHHHRHHHHHHREEPRPRKLKLRFDVFDTGSGIAEDHLERIFEPFVQVEGSITREHGGSGLGLAIVQSLAKLMGGRVTVKSRLGRGSTFSFTALFDITAPAAGAEEEEDHLVPEVVTAVRGFLRGRKVLCHLRNQLNIEYVAQIFKGAKVTSVTSFAALTHRLPEGHDLVVVESGAHGHELRALAHLHADTPLVVLGHAQDGLLSSMPRGHFSALPIRRRHLSQTVLNALTGCPRSPPSRPVRIVRATDRRNNKQHEEAPSQQQAAEGLPPMTLSKNNKTTQHQHQQEEPRQRPPLEEEGKQDWTTTTTTTTVFPGATAGNEERPMSPPSSSAPEGDRPPSASAKLDVHMSSSSLSTTALPPLSKSSCCSPLGTKRDAPEATTDDVVDSQRGPKRSKRSATPVDEADDEASSSGARSPGAAAAAFLTRAPSVLLVEDNPVNAKVASRMISKLGFTSDVAENGRRGIDVFIEHGQFDFAFIDLHMPVLNGYDCVAAIRDYEQRQQLPRTPIVCLTADATKGLEVQLREAGFDGLLHKPTRLRLFKDTMLDLLPSSGSARDILSRHIFPALTMDDHAAARQASPFMVPRGPSGAAATKSTTTTTTRAPAGGGGESGGSGGGDKNHTKSPGPANSGAA